MDIPRLHPDTIDEVKQRADIVDVVADRVVLKKRGKDYLGLCPFHEEKTPSFSVSPSKQMFYCFGCNAGGNAIKFLMDADKASFSDVVLNLARRYQVPVRTLEPEQRQELQRQLSLREQLYEVLAVAANFFQHALRQPQGEAALNYLKQARQLNEETIQQFGLGYAPVGWETLYRYLVEAKRFSLGLVEQAGLIRQRKSGEGYYDYFRDRLMIPICDPQGRTIGFGSRTLTNEEPKYLNSPETPVFNKGKTLFALDRAKSEIAKQDRAVVVEGYFDAIALHSCGIANAVASLGTAFSQEQLKQILRYTPSKQVAFNFDSDAAGTKATQRAIAEIETLIYSGQVQLRILNLPDGKDADEFLKSSPQAPDRYRQQLQDAPLWLNWQIDRLLVDVDLTQSDRFEQVAGQMTELLNRLEDPNKRTHYIRYCAEILSQGDSRLAPIYVKNFLAELKKPRKKNQPQRATILQFQESADRHLLQQAEALLLLIYLHRPQYRQAIIDALEEKDLIFSLPHHRFLWQKIIELPADRSDNLPSQLQDAIAQQPQLSPQLIPLFHLDEMKSQAISRPLLVIRDALIGIEKVTWEKRQSYCYQKWQEIDPNRDAKNWQYYYQEYYNAKRKIIELEKERTVSLSDIFGRSG